MVIIIMRISVEALKGPTAEMAGFCVVLVRATGTIRKPCLVERRGRRPGTPDNCNPSAAEVVEDKPERGPAKSARLKQ